MLAELQSVWTFWLLSVIACVSKYFLTLESDCMGVLRVDFLHAKSAAQEVFYRVGRGQFMWISIWLCQVSACALQRAVSGQCMCVSALGSPWCARLLNACGFCTRELSCVKVRSMGTYGNREACCENVTSRMLQLAMGPTL